MKKIMVIDDSEPDQFLIEIMIKKFDPEIKIVKAYDGKEALDILALTSVQPDIIFLDINMPVMNGHEFLEEYSKRPKQQTVVVMLTSSDQEDDKKRSRAHECVKKFLAKPLTPIVLEELRECL